MIENLSFAPVFKAQTTHTYTQSQNTRTQIKPLAGRFNIIPRHRLKKKKKTFFFLTQPWKAVISRASSRVWTHLQVKLSTLIQSSLLYQCKTRIILAVMTKTMWINVYRAISPLPAQSYSPKNLALTFWINLASYFAGVCSELTYYLVSVLSPPPPPNVEHTLV